jgi:hypothetical protein
MDQFTANVAAKVFCGYKKKENRAHKNKCPRCEEIYLGNEIELCVPCEAELIRAEAEKEGRQ